MRKLEFGDSPKLYNHQVSKSGFKFGPNSKPHSHSNSMKSPPDFSQRLPEDLSSGVHPAAVRGTGSPMVLLHHTMHQKGTALRTLSQKEEVIGGLGTGRWTLQETGLLESETAPRMLIMTKCVYRTSACFG